MSLVYSTCRPEASAPGGGTIVTRQHPNRNNSIYVGGKVDAKNRTWLEQRGITHILNVTPPKEAGIKAGVPNFFESSGKFTYKRIAVYDASTSNLLEHADSLVSFISAALHHGSVLCHCQHGVSRSATSVAFYLMRKAGMTLDEAMRSMSEKRPAINPIPAFRTQLKQYEQKCVALMLGAAVGAIGNNKGTKRKPDGRSSSRRNKGLIGPSALPPPSRMIGPSIGPALLPPDTITARETPEKTVVIEKDGNKRRKYIGPTMPPLRSTIGPYLPPPLTDNQKGGIIGPSIGPALAAPNKISVGPALPPKS